MLTQLKDAIELINNTTSNQDGKSLWNRISPTVSVAKDKIKGVKNSKSNMGVLDSMYRAIALAGTGGGKLINSIAETTNSDKTTSSNKTNSKPPPTVPNFTCLMDSMHSLLIALKNAFQAEKVFQANSLSECQLYGNPRSGCLHAPMESLFLCYQERWH